MNTWSVPPADLGGICVYDHPAARRVFNGPSQTGVEDMTTEHCMEYCKGLGNGFQNYKSFGYR